MSEVKEHSVIYLSPSDDPEREWCQDDVWEESVRYNLGAEFDRVTAERDALQALLTAADERADELVTALSKIKLRLDAFVEAERDMPSPSVEVCQSIAYAALKPAEAAKCCTVSPEDRALLDAGDYTPEELWGAGGKPSCPKCAKP